MILCFIFVKSSSQMLLIDLCITISKTTQGHENGDKSLAPISFAFHLIIKRLALNLTLSLSNHFICTDKSLAQFSICIIVI